MCVTSQFYVLFNTQTSTTLVTHSTIFYLDPSRILQIFNIYSFSPTLFGLHVLIFFCKGWDVGHLSIICFVKQSNFYICNTFHTTFYLDPSLNTSSLLSTYLVTFTHFLLTLFCLHSTSFAKATMCATSQLYSLFSRGTSAISVTHSTHPSLNRF